jgi:ferrous iron transport protein B
LRSSNCHSVGEPKAVVAAERLPLVALVGNPNAGKTTLFNSLTGSRQKVGNYPGVTVEKVSGFLDLSGGPVECIDVPGLYSLVPVSEDERVAAGVIHGDGLGAEKPDLLVCVIDATNLERNLYFFSQLTNTGLPILVALTMTDRLKSSGRELDLAALSDQLHCEVVPLVGHRDQGIQDLRDAIDRTLRPEFVWVQGHDGFEDEITSRYAWAAQVQLKAVRQASPKSHTRSRTDKIDVLLTNRVFGLAFFVAVMYAVFQSIYTLAQPVMDVISNGFDKLANFAAAHLASIPWLQSLVADGLIRGVGGVLVFLPQILILFFFIAMLEGTGYLARAAFLMDRLLGWCGLNGRAFIPLLSSFACAIPGIMAARVMPDAKSRLATIMVAPLMSCSARLPVYLLLIGAFIQPRFGAFWAGFALFAMHFLGLLVAIPVVWFLNRGIIKGRRLPFLLELPPYQWPKWRDVWIAMYLRGQIFVKTAGTVIVAMSVVIWALSYFPRMSPSEVGKLRTQYATAYPNAKPAEISQQVDQGELAHSVLGRFGKAIEPAFIPAGFDWRITTSILAAFPARETVVPSLGIIFSLGKDVDEKDAGLQNALQSATWPDGRKLFTPWTAVGMMVFFALCAQCFSTLATVRRETNSWKWPAFMFTYMTGLAYVAAVFVHYLGIWI